MSASASGQTLCLNCHAPVGEPHTKRCKAIMRAERVRRSALRDLVKHDNVLTIPVSVGKAHCAKCKETHPNLLTIGSVDYCPQHALNAIDTEQRHLSGMWARAWDLLVDENEPDAQYETN